MRKSRQDNTKMIERSRGNRLGTFISPPSGKHGNSGDYEAKVISSCSKDVESALTLSFSERKTVAILNLERE
jgi:hypothetical protein